MATSGLGLPLALCGGFALTYTVQSGTAKYAVRCFHKQSNALEQRYAAISKRLQALKSPYFLTFEFQPQGIKISGKAFPVVKMAWATGSTLGEFIENNHKKPQLLTALGDSLRNLAKFLASHQIAHGDIQPGNVMVSGAGKTLQLIDYDGMFIGELKSLGSSELGHRNFQHPKRTSSAWDGSLDRFSFIALDVSIRALREFPDLWTKTNSDGDAVLFRANDFADPFSSKVLGELGSKSSLSGDIQKLVAVCCAPFDQVPTLEDFLAGRNIPQIKAQASQKAAATPKTYLAAFPVVDALNYDYCLKYVGDKVEVIGQVIEIKQSKTRHGKPYVFINFGPWQGRIVKISIWSEGLAVMRNPPNDSWVGMWISVVGLMEPPYVNKRHHYSHLAVSVNQANQLHVIASDEARFRLGGSSTRANPTNAAGNNKDIVASIKQRKPSEIPKPAGSANQSWVSAMRSSQRPYASSGSVISKSSSSPNYRSPSPSANRPPSVSTKPPQKNQTDNNCFIATAVYGRDAPETNALRRWRDEKLLISPWGRLLTQTYYLVSPYVAESIGKSVFFKRQVRRLLDAHVRRINSRF